MSEGFPFIGRQAEMAKVEQALFDWGATYFLFVYSENGGIGKTRLMQEVYSKYSNREYDEHNLLVVPIIDFDDRSVNSRGTLQRKMVEVLGDENFTTYLQRMVDWRKVEAAGVSPQRLEEESNRVRKEFQNCLQQITLTRRVVFLIDTTDKVEGGEIWDFLKSVLAESRNIVIVISGRNAKDIHATYFQNSTARFRQTLIALGPFTSEESDRYLQAKIAQDIKQEFNNETVEKIKSLSKGIPILFDLALERLAQDDQFAVFLSSRSKEYFENLSIENRGESEKIMVSYLAHQRSELAELVLLLAHVYPVNKAMLQTMLGKESTTDVEQLIKKALTTVYIKQLPGERISLHDEMRRMVLEHVWPACDPENNQRREYSQKAAGFFDADIRFLSGKISDLHKPHVSLSESVELDNLSRRRDNTQMEYLRHLLVIDMNQGAEYYLRTVSDARKSHRLRFAQRLGNYIKDVEPRLDEKYRYRVKIARINQLIDRGAQSIGEARQLLQQLLSANTENDENTLEILNLLGRCEELTGNYQLALKYEEKTLAGLVKPFDRLRVENYIGYIYRLMGDWRKATKHYKNALDTAQNSESVTLDTVANIYNNLAYVVCLMGNYVEAREYCLEAIRIWESKGVTSSLGRGYVTRGVISRDRGRYDNATVYFKKAIEIFRKLEEPDDFKNLAGAYFEYAWSLWFEGDGLAFDGMEDEAYDLYKRSKDYFDQARDLAREYEVVSLLPGILNQMSNIYWRLGLREDARQLVEEAYELSKKYNDIRHQVDSLLGFAEFDVETGRYDRLQSYAKELKENYEDQGYDFPLFYGRMKRILGEAALFSGDFGRSKDYYATGISQISQHGGYGLYFLDRELARLKKNMTEHLPPDLVIAWLTFFKNMWMYDASKQEEKLGKLISWCSTFMNQTKFNTASHE